MKSLDDFYVQGFYHEDIRLLKNLGYEVVLTNKLYHFFFLKYDIAFLYFYKKSFFSAFIARLIRHKKVFFTGGIDDLSNELEASSLRKLIYTLFFLMCYLLSNGINVVSASDYKNVSSILLRYNIKSKKVFCFPHSYTINNLDLNLSSKKNNFVSICWMSTVGNVKRKGLDKALIFFSNMYDIYPDSKFYIIGTIGEGTEYLKGMEVYPKIKDRVFFTGFLDENKKNNFLYQAKFYLQFSKYEGFGLAALEANLFKCFILHSGSGGFLNSIDIWGKEINILNKNVVTKFFNDFNYSNEFHSFNLRYHLFMNKFSSEERMNSLKMLLNEQ